MAKCDVCGGQCEAHEMTALRDMYAQPGLKDMCPKCCEWAEGQLREIRDDQETELKRRICVRAARPVVKARDGWLRGLWITVGLGFSIYACILFFNHCL